jgi:hypothetical protein
MTQLYEAHMQHLGLTFSVPSFMNLVCSYNWTFEITKYACINCVNFSMWFTSICVDVYLIFKCYTLIVIFETTQIVVSIYKNLRIGSRYLNVSRATWKGAAVSQSLFNQTKVFYAHY